ncbi:MAG: hypothetical protein QW046_02970 [Candidatus Micrarchaeaceae archaeon]
MTLESELAEIKRRLERLENAIYGSDNNPGLKALFLARDEQLREIQQQLDLLMKQQQQLDKKIDRVMRLMSAVAALSAAVGVILGYLISAIK